VDRYRVVFHEGLLVDTDLQNWLNIESGNGWRFAGAIPIPAHDGVPFQMLVVLERE